MSVTFVLRAVTAGLAYAALRILAVVIDPPSATAGTQGLIARSALELLAGMLVGMTLGAVARVMAGSPRRRGIALATLIFLSTLAVMIEGAAFQPSVVPTELLPLEAILQLGVALATATVVAGLFRPARPAAPLAHAPHRTAWSWLWRYGASALTYVVLYFVVGAANYSLVTGPYYQAHTAGLVIPAPDLVLLVALLEGAIFPMALLPLMYALPLPTRSRALVAGTMLFVLGGLVPLVVSADLPIFLRASSAVEIFFQKFPAGVAAAALLGPQDTCAIPDPADVP